MLPEGLPRRRILALSTAALAGCASVPVSIESGDDPTPTPQAPQYDTSLEHDEAAWDGYDPE